MARTYAARPIPVLRGSGQHRWSNNARSTNAAHSALRRPAIGRPTCRSRTARRRRRCSCSGVPAGRIARWTIFPLFLQP